MEFRVILLLGFASSVFSDLNGDQQNSFNYQPNEGQNQQGFGGNVYGNKISQGETKPAMNQGELQRTRLPMSTIGLPYPTPFYGQFQPLQPIQASSHPEVTSESQSPATPQLQKPTTTPEIYNHLALPVQYPYPYPSFAPRPLTTISTPVPHTANVNNALLGPYIHPPLNQNSNDLANQDEDVVPPQPLAYTYPVPIPMPFPSFFPYPQVQYPR